MNNHQQVAPLQQQKKERKIQMQRKMKDPIINMEYERTTMALLPWFNKLCESYLSLEHHHHGKFSIKGHYYISIDQHSQVSTSYNHIVQEEIIIFKNHINKQYRKKKR